MHVGAIIGRQQRRQMQVDLGGDIERLRQVGLAAGLHRAHRVVQHVGVEIESDFLHFAALRFAEHFARAADLQVVHREVEAGAELFHHLYRLESFFRAGRQRLVAWGEQIGIGLMMRAADAAAQLMQLRQAEAVGALDDDGVRGRNVDAGLDDG